MSQDAIRYVADGEPLTRFRELERIATTRATSTDYGQPVPSGSEGTIVDVIKDGVAYAVEFSMPVDGLATLLPHELRKLDGPHM